LVLYLWFQYHHPGRAVYASLRKTAGLLVRRFGRHSRRRAHRCPARLARAIPAYPGAVGWLDARQSSTRYLQATLSEAGIRPIHAQDGQTFDLG